MKHKINIETDRLKLRNITKDDKDFVIQLWMNEDVTKYMGGPRSLEFMEENIKESIDDPYLYEFDLWIVEDLEHHLPIGHCGILDKEIDGVIEYEINYIFNKTAWGKGYGSEIAEALIRYAFNEKGFKRVVALIDPLNVASEKVAIKVGMHHEKDVLRGKELKMLYVIDSNEK